MPGKSATRVRERAKNAARTRLTASTHVRLDIGQHVKVREIAAWEGREIDDVMRTLVWLGLSVYERLCANLAGRAAADPVRWRDTPTGHDGAPSPSAGVMRWFVDDMIGRTILDEEAAMIVSRETAARRLESDRAAAAADAERERQRLAAARGRLGVVGGEEESSDWHAVSE